MASTPEGRIQAAVSKYAKTLGILVRRQYVRAGGARGWPDTEFYLPRGKTVHIEFKAPGGQPSKIQQKRIDDLLALGHLAYVCDNVDEGKRILNSHLA